jgi:hypothetical protein
MVACFNFFSPHSIFLPKHSASIASLGETNCSAWWIFHSSFDKTFVSPRSSSKVNDPFWKKARMRDCIVY